MIYFDNGATTLQKPSRVLKAVQNAMVDCANPGRSGHKPAQKAAKIVFECRQAACQLFHINDPQQVVFTINATHALNLAIKSLLRQGGHAVISGYEHNSVVRPLESMKSRGVEYTIARSPLFDKEMAVSAITEALRWDTSCVILNHVSNVFGFELPLAEVDALCHKRGIPLIVDASQSAGNWPLDCSKLLASVFVAMPGHKGLYGPQGTGMLLCLKTDRLHTLIEGGTGSNSIQLTQPDFLPDIFESGTMNVPGIAGLYEGIRFVLAKKPENILTHERRLVRHGVKGLKSIKGINVFESGGEQSGVLSFTAEGIEPEALGEMLAQKGICTRAGLHCAPLAHQSGGTLPDGTLRISFSVFNTVSEVKIFVAAVHDLIKGYRQG